MFKLREEERKIIENQRRNALLHVSELDCLLYQISNKSSYFRSDDLIVNSKVPQISTQDGKPFTIKEKTLLVVEFKTDGKPMKLGCEDSEHWFKVMWVSLFPNAEPIGDLAIYGIDPKLDSYLPEGTYWLNIAMPRNAGPIKYFAVQ